MATVDFPVAREPVSPIRSIFLSFLLVLQSLWFENRYRGEYWSRRGRGGDCGGVGSVVIDLFQKFKESGFKYEGINED